MYFPADQRRKTEQINRTQRGNQIQYADLTTNKAQKTDQEYFNSLNHFKPIFYNGKGSPIFLKNQNWWRSLTCIGIFDLIFIVSLVMFMISGNNQSSNGQDQIQRSRQLLPKNSKQSADNLVILLASIICLILINLTFFLCQFMNPGVRNPVSIQEEEFEKDGKVFCQLCRNFKTKQMNHCKQCQVCVWGLDHHCGFFNKCIAGWQKWAFYAFMTTIFGGFLLIVVCLGLSLTY